ncbi:MULTISPECIES: methyl-accepting chemotaxis protein [Marisediminitalea]|jgi:methyl-accepting chemotaxis protein|uniref:methyl-accepting chemotaxis protein n=1 Tax=Marisediminitalea TaxID=2662254 RepID=UPI0020CE3F3C|nr:methyl-accepting chemotaxis protein [Marisediminitalea aggregata]MCP3865583.1 methyl-accepting chemotaxis protein [Aestuariibacter sp.]MCP4238637.1 methyl-accepting chemotaxis protein [Aestuariibacter sp.]MCP4524346.1 methyl-accepting chemotaxis protein [Aestuariibacter sp.]MCP4949754.1 methyl-accepting chemotaxis protein [Aestuariibacter sp.]MCP5011069.1 methyl-accepting chemotaxis protein [Aestuariibacter sp.]|tara:strand:- start:652 stop:2571 length:1920 start_codon:yes stop_codon:yes gene_type:complete
MRFASLSIKQKLILILVIAVLASTLLVGTIQQYIARKLVEQNMESVQLPNMVKQVANRVDKEVTVMKSVAYSIANNPDVIAWSQAGANRAGETQLVNYLGQLKDFNDLTVTSFVDRQTHKYWNQDGFLRVLKNDEFDGWFFAYKDSGQPVSLSLYNEPGQGYRLFANYQQVNGRGMSGVAKSVDDLMAVLNSVKIAESGFIFMADEKGTINAHANTNLLGKSHLRDITSSAIASTLLTKQDFNLIRGEVEGEDMLFASTYVESAGWYVIAQVPVSELYTEMNSASVSMITWSIIIALGFALLGVWFAGSISKPLENLASVFTQLGNGQGDLTTRIPLPDQKETRKLVEGFNQFTASLHGILTNVAATSVQIRQSAAQVAEQSAMTESNSETQRDSTMQVATALNQMGSTVNEIAQSAHDAASSANHSAKASADGQAFTQQAVDSIHQLAGQISSVTSVIESLDAHTDDIVSILETIRGISDQTNLLALNAAIEAARAGDHGRGFSVVADEVRTLAQRAASSTEEIQSKIDSFKQDSQTAVEQMRLSNKQTTQVVEAAQQIDVMLKDIADDIQIIHGINTQVATATDEQSVVVEDINRNIHAISDNSDNNLRSAKQMVATSKTMAELAEQLDDEVSKFKL